MKQISTKLGLMSESELDYKEGTDDSELESATWKEWYFKGELVKREVSVQLKDLSMGASVAF
jgi:hypothetical protein